MKKVCVIVTVLAGILLPATSITFETIQLQGSLGDVAQQAGYARIQAAGDMFWWYYPTSQANRPVLLWLSGVTELPPSLAANIGMFGPYDHNMNRREDSWLEDYNLLFIDAPLGTGFSAPLSDDTIPRSVEENAEHILLTLASFYSLHDELFETPLYVFGEGHGAQLALALAKRLHEGDDAEAIAIYRRIQGVALGNGVVSPGLALTKLGFYLEELGYIDANGRSVLEALASDTQHLISIGQLRQAFSNFLSLGEAVNERAGAVAVNLRHIIEKVTRESTAEPDYFGRMKHLRSALRSDARLFQFMDDVAAPALGVTAQSYDAGRAAAIDAFRDSYMAPAVSMVEYILQNTNRTVSIYNGNLDAVSNTLGQLEWVDSLQWHGQEEFLNSTRAFLVLNQQMEGYMRETDYLRFYWVNAAGQSVPLDSPLAMRRVLRGIAGF